MRIAHPNLLPSNGLLPYIGKIGCISNARFMGTAIVNLKVGIFMDSIPENILSQEERQGLKSNGGEK